MSVWLYLLNTHLSNTFKPPDLAGGAIGDFKVKHSVFDPKASIKSEGRQALGRVFCCMQDALGTQGRKQDGGFPAGRTST